MKYRIMMVVTIVLIFAGLAGCSARKSDVVGFYYDKTTFDQEGFLYFYVFRDNNTGYFVRQDDCSFTWKDGEMVTEWSSEPIPYVIENGILKVSDAPDIEYVKTEDKNFIPAEWEDYIETGVIPE